MSEITVLDLVVSLSNECLCRE